MIVTCEQCQIRFNLIDDMIKSGGSKVRCSRCKHVFTVFPSSPAAGEPGASPWITDVVFPSDALVQKPEEIVTEPEIPEAIIAEPETPEAIVAELETPEAGTRDVPDAENLFGDFEEMDLSDLEKPDSQAEPSHPEAAGIGDLDLKLSFEEENEKTGEGWEPEVLDLSEIEKLVEESRTRESERGSIEIEDLEFSLDLEEQDVKDETPEETVHLDISELELAGQEDESVGSPEDDFDFGDLDLKFDLEEEKAQTPEETVHLDISDLELAGQEAESVGSPEDDFDFGDLELKLDLEEEKAQTPNETVHLDISEPEQAGQEVESEGSPEDDFDFGDLELKLDLGEEKAQTPEETVHLDMFELEDVGDKGTEKKVPEIQDLDLLLDLDREENGLKLDDFSDIEKMVEESAGRQPAKGESNSREDFELDLNLDLEPEIKGDEKTVLDLEEIDRLDLSEIGILDLEPSTREAEPAPQARRRTGLEKTGAAFREASPATALSGATTPSLTAGEPEADETEGKLDYPEQDRMPAGQAAVGGGEGFRLKGFGDEAVLEEEEAAAGTKASDSKKKSAPRRSKRISAPVLALLILTLLTCAGYGGFILVDRMGIEIPFVSRYIDQYFGPKVEDPGNLRIEAFDITSQFVDNQAAGKLFVITGRLKNGYPEPRGFISVTAKLYTKGKVTAKTETAFGGNVLSDTELANLDLEAVKKRLSSRVGDNRSNVRIPAGGVIPFMVVFSNLPEDMEEFSLEVTGSMPASTT